MPDEEEPAPTGGTGRVTSAREHQRRLDRLGRALGARDDLPLDPDLAPDNGEPPFPAGGAAPVPARRPRPAAVGAVFVGGALGTWARYAVEQAWPAAAGHFPTATFVINTSGAFLLGFLLTALLERFAPHHLHLRPFLGTGVLGGWTTYSTLVVESVTLAKDGRVALGAGYLALTVMSGLVATAAGIGLGRSRTLPAPVPSRGEEQADDEGDVELRGAGR
jgi:fluoride exporter